MADTFIPMSTWTPRNGQTYEIVDKDARERITVLERGGGSGGANGKSAYEIAVDHGFSGTEAQWLASLAGPPGPAGESGSDYVLTAQDKSDIAALVVGLIPSAESEAF